MLRCIYLIFVFWFFLPRPAYAYLDPGTGNVLIYVAMSFFGALIFSLKGLSYKLLGKDSATDGNHLREEQWHRIVLFSEGKIYWNTFRPIVEALLKKNVPFSYYTMDIEDPCLTINEENMNNRYIGNGTRAFVKMGKLKAQVVLSTTPNIGCEGYPIPKSKNIQKLVHVFHDIGDIAGYYRGAFDSYDAILAVGNHTEPAIRKLEALRGLPAKEIHPAGLPYMDILLPETEKAPRFKSSHDRKTILIAPSWGAKGSLSQYGTDFIRELAETGNYHIIIRPHPYSLKIEKVFIEEVQHTLEKCSNISWDFAIDGTASMQQADLLISDSSSGMRADFLLLYQKPLITLRIPNERTEFLEVADLKEYWMEQAFKPFERIVEPDSIGQLPSIVAEGIEKGIQENIDDFIHKNFYHWGSTGEAVADYLISLNLQKITRL